MTGRVVARRLGRGQGGVAVTGVLHEGERAPPCRLGQLRQRCSTTASARRALTTRRRSEARAAAMGVHLDDDCAPSVSTVAAGARAAAAVLDDC